MLRDLGRNAGDQCIDVRTLFGRERVDASIEAEHRRAMRQRPARDRQDETIQAQSNASTRFAVIRDVIHAMNGKTLAGAVAIGAGSARACVAVAGACRGRRFVLMVSSPIPFDAAPAGWRRALWLAAVRPAVIWPGPCALKTITDTNGNHGRGERRLRGDRPVDMRRGVHEGLFHIDVRDPVRRDHIVQPGIERRANTGTVSRLGYPAGDIRMAVIEKHNRQPNPAIGDEIAILAMILQRDRRRQHPDAADIGFGP